MRDDKAYYHARAEAELRMARTSTEASATKAHYTLAGYYLDRAFGGDHRGHVERLSGVARI
ncbi:hypothetical protein QE361_001143 [Sphingomonas sp. SORGH_AS802]|jgi:hypothetical protein|uniref:hypothetical protein n=1 Tax=unclassified Sphingomonas TaxID=196159 RepID=UPI000F7EF0AB|nr:MULTISPECIES: hypothetical protein [unclassified Sphingomonas]MDR6125553.1 hypothetical protein [Sphingomonas sp. SORGH_AS_0438]MDR6134168.1 hypothetical protein [Sphingomonas sp. SORGH_AS_0802]RSU49260.1 hypothetical protein BRX43_11040 [Sphingomonas sp. S-NIH.Pt15_0812]